MALATPACATSVALSAVFNMLFSRDAAKVKVLARRRLQLEIANDGEGKGGVVQLIAIASAIKVYEVRR